MIKAVFFDLYHTLVRYEPPREEIESRVLQEFGVAVSPEALGRPMLIADEFIYNEIARRPLSARSREEIAALYAQYQEILLKEAGVKYDQKLVFALLGKMQQARMDLVPFDDVKPALDVLKKRGLVLGLISNIEQDMTGTLDRLGLRSWLGVVVTSQDAGANKPNPEIFQYALQQAGVLPAEAIYVGDQYQVDVLGARGAGMKAILLDRTGHHEDITDCPRIGSLSEVVEHLE
jgi:putative hydrolase of the HAD superfamily